MERTTRLCSVIAIHPYMKRYSRRCSTSKAPQECADCFEKPMNTASKHHRAASHLSPPRYQATATEAIPTERCLAHTTISAQSSADSSVLPSGYKSGGEVPTHHRVDTARGCYVCSVTEAGGSNGYKPSIRVQLQFGLGLGCMCRLLQKRLQLQQLLQSS